MAKLCFREYLLIIKRDERPKSEALNFRSGSNLTLDMVSVWQAQNVGKVSGMLLKDLAERIAGRLFLRNALEDC